MTSLNVGAQHRCAPSPLDRSASSRPLGAAPFLVLKGCGFRFNPHPSHPDDLAHVRAQHRCAPCPQNRIRANPWFFFSFRLSTVACQPLPLPLPLPLHRCFVTSLLHYFAFRSHCPTPAHPSTPLSHSAHRQLPLFHSPLHHRPTGHSP